MQFSPSSTNALLVVVTIHVAVLASVFYSNTQEPQIVVTPPSIQGVLVMAEPEAVPPPPEPPPPPPPEPPPPEPKPAPKPKPVPKAPPSERAVKAPEPEPPPPPPAPVEAPPTPAAPVPAPVLPPRAEAGQLSNPAPVYPTLSRRLREEGIVVLEILIKADGSVGEIKLKTSSGHKRLDDTAMKAVARWRYQPATQGGKAIDYWYQQDVEFNLH